VRRVVSGHGGEVTLRSEPGETTFRVQLPVHAR
jgi:nitrogen-specific signal transduction histidine kinase